DHHDAPENRKVEPEDGPVPPRQPADHPASRHRERESLEDLRKPGGRRHPDLRRRLRCCDYFAHRGCSLRLPAPCPGWYRGVPQAFPSTVLYGTKPDKSSAAAKGAPEVGAATAATGEPAVGEPQTGTDPFRLRLLDGLATSIGERGYRASTVADIV